MKIDVDGAYWMRAGDKLVAMTPKQLRKIFEDGKPDWLAEQANAFKFLDFGWFQQKGFLKCSPATKRPASVCA